MKKYVSLIPIIILIISVATASAQDQKPKKLPNETTISGEIVDIKCFLTAMMKGRGENHKECAIMCIKDGLPVGILDDSTNEVYIVVPKGGMKSGNDELMQYAAQNVKLTGTILKKNGQSMFLYSKIEAVQ